MEASAKKTKLMTNNTSGNNTEIKVNGQNSHKLQLPGLSYNWWGFQARDTLQDSTDNSSIDRFETSLEWQEYFSQFQDTIDAVTSIFLYACESWTLTVRAPKKNTSHESEVLLQDTTHLI